MIVETINEPLYQVKPQKISTLKLKPSYESTIQSNAHRNESAVNEDDKSIIEYDSEIKANLSKQGEVSM